MKPKPTVKGNVPLSGEVSWKEVMVVPGGGEPAFETVTVTVALVAELFEVSVATAFRE